MRKLRYLHLYMGVIFAPILIFLAFSGLWQTFDVHGVKALKLLSTIHTSHNLKSGGYSSVWMKGFVVIATFSYIFTVVLGIALSFKFGRARNVIYCLAAGTITPIVLALLFSTHRG